MAQPARFTFDLDLTHRPKVPTPSVPEDVVVQLIAQAREEAFAEGFAAGETSAANRAAKAVSDAALSIAGQSANMAAALDDANKAHLRDAVGLAASVGRKIAVSLMLRQPTAELDALIAECMQNLAGVPHLVIRCHPDIADAIRDIATAHMATSGFDGRLIVMGDPDQPMGDGRLEWIEGGLVRDIEAISQDIDNRISAYLAAYAGAGHTEQEHDQ